MYASTNNANTNGFLLTLVILRTIESQPEQEVLGESLVYDDFFFFQTQIKETLILAGNYNIPNTKSVQQLTLFSGK